MGLNCYTQNLFMNKKWGTDLICETKNLLLFTLKSLQTLLKQDKVIIISPVKIILTVTVQINSKYISVVIQLKLVCQNILTYPFFPAVMVNLLYLWT